MTKVVLNKLVRDKIPHIIKKDGVTPTVHIANDKEFKIKLIEKLGEEVREFQESYSPNELVDILEVVLALAKLNGISPTELEKMRIDKAHKRGGYKKKVILESTTKDETK